MTNIALADYVIKLANEKNVTSAQIALAWLLAKIDFIIPIPGTKKISRIEENIGSQNDTFTDAELNAIREKLDSIEILGDRYHAAHKKLVK